MVETIAVEIAYALPERQTLLSINVPLDSTIKQAIELSGILAIYPEIDLTQNKVGIWSRTAKLDDVLNPTDRIEIYRPLIADPKDLRRRRAEKAKEEGRADKTTGGRPHTAQTAD